MNVLEPHAISARIVEPETETTRAPVRSTSPSFAMLTPSICAFRDADGVVGAAAAARYTLPEETGAVVRETAAPEICDEEENCVYTWNRNRAIKSADATVTISVAFIFWNGMIDNRGLIQQMHL